MTINVLVTGLGGGGHGEQILKALKMSTLDLRIAGADITRISKGLSDVADGHVLPPATAPNYLDELFALCKAKSIQVLFPGSEPELKKLSAHREDVAKAGMFMPINTAHVIDTCMDKFKTVRFLTDNGFKFPRTTRITSLDDAKGIDTFPVVLKPSIGAGGSANAMIAQSKDELLAFCAYLLAIYPEFIVQEYVGTPDHEYTVGVLTSLDDGAVINSIAVRRTILSSLSNRLKVKNTSGRADLGDTLAISSGISQGHIGKYPEVTSQCEAIAKALGSRGPLNLQCRFANGHVYVFEINPRYSGTSSMRAMVGFNEPELMIRKHYLHETIPVGFSYREGHMLRGLAETFIADESAS